MKWNLILLTVTLLFADNINAQHYVQNHTIREADVMWSMRVWRELDLRQKLNHPMYYPIEQSQGYSSLYQVLLDGINSGQLTAYGTGPLGQDDEFTQILSIGQVRAITHSTDSIWTPNIDDDDYSMVIVSDSIRSEMITRYRIKEDWIFDRNRSQMVVRILGIAPLVEQFSGDGQSRGFTTLFWINFEEARQVLATAPVFIRHNDNRALNYDDLLSKRFFASRVIKASNVYDRDIASYVSGLDALLEGEAIEERLLNFESDCWSY